MSTDLRTAGSDRIAFALTVFAALALASLSMGLVDAALVDGLGKLAGKLLDVVTGPGIRLPVAKGPIFVGDVPLV